MNGTVFSATMVPLTSAVGIFTGMLPDIKDVRKATRQDATMKHDMRVGQAAASVVVLSLGAAASHFSKSRLPLIASLIVVIGLVVMYETILTVTPPERTL